MIKHKAEGVNLKSVSISDGCAVICLSSSFYRLEAVRQALEDFREVCSGKIREGAKMEIIIKPNDSSDPKVIGLEFCNYVLGLMRNMG